MKSPNNFFSTREGFEKRMMDLLSKWTKKFLYRCYSCSNFFQSVDELNAHNTLWCQMQYRNAAELNVSKLFPEPEVSNASTDRTMSDRDRREEMIQHLAHLEALSNSCNDCTKQTIDFRAHLTMHSNATLLPPQQQNVASDDVVADVAILTTSSLRSRHYELVPANEFDDSVSSTVRKINDPTKFSTCVEMAVLQSTSESRKSARTTLRNVAEDRGQIIQVTKRFFDQLNCIDG